VTSTCCSHAAVSPCEKTPRHSEAATENLLGAVFERIGIAIQSGERFAGEMEGTSDENRLGVGAS